MLESTEKFGNRLDFKTLHVMEEFAGHSVAYLLHELGYTDLFKLADENPGNIYYMPFIGPKRFSKIVSCLKSKGLDFDYDAYLPFGALTPER
ncbi:hypothetical protein [Ponticaulis sp.]|uniref:hypothetical protein n=1 Tax=Ponticaulis sp. TaxID=2020902 RepID=UPI000B6AED0F|nr:hypothetical protein [Ponticaulis sp.]MAJ09237.1 hypothetical protein [Ponticaulis sp.]HBJ91321.1 hypothetical protein [Hyphomonadaceae bacterium]|tara:strand:- start:235 stop:510 length:276 start_codon:yes stop_codon:yes gene_type:complete